MEKIINLTPHDIHVRTAQGEMKTFPRSGQIARVAQESRLETSVAGVPVAVPTFGAVLDLPAEEPNTFLLVSMMIRNALPSRRDLLSPGDMLRDEAGKIIGCVSFHRNA